MIRTQIYLTEKQYRVLKEKSHEENESIAGVLRKLVDKEIVQVQDKAASNKKKNVGNTLLAMARRAEKECYSGPPDLASNVDAYLYGGKK
jgi:hypothetical protein